MPSFDVVSQLNLQEVKNAIQQASREVGQRYDFKGITADINLEEKGILLVCEDDFKLKSLLDVLQNKLVSRKVDLKAVKPEAVEDGPGGTRKQFLCFQQGISQDQARTITKLIKSSKMKVQAQIQGDQVRIIGKKRDDLQEAIQLVKEKVKDIPLQFVNMRD